MCSVKRCECERVCVGAPPSPLLPLLRTVARFGTPHGSNELTSSGLKQTQTQPVLGWTQKGDFSKWLR